MTEMIIDITQKDIDKANRKRASKDFCGWKDCLVSTAIERITGKKAWCGQYQFHHDGTTYDMPDEAAQLVQNFMRGVPVAPTTFTAKG